MSGSGPIASADAAIRAMWDARWDGPSDVPVRWDANSHEPIPSAATVSHWLHNIIEFSGERTVAFGGGRGANERELTGRVLITVFAKRGHGEATLRGLLDDALDVFRSQRSDGLTFVGEWGFPDGAPSDDGIWWYRQALAAFVYRFQG